MVVWGDMGYNQGPADRGDGYQHGAVGSAGGVEAAPGGAAPG